METQTSLLSLLLFLPTALLLTVTGLKRQPGLGVIGAAVIALAALWIRGDNLATFGYSPPDSWMQTLCCGLVLGLVIQGLSVAGIEPLSEKLTQSAHDHSLVEGVRGNWRAFLQWLILIWLLVALLEEGIYRGFLMTEFAKIAGQGSMATLINILLTSIVFGLSHGYQGRSGIVSTGIIGLFLGSIYVVSSFNLWLAIATHGFIDTLGIGLVAIGADRTIQQKLWGGHGPGSGPGEFESGG